MMDTLRIATRKSKLALWQANYVKQKLLKINPKCCVELIEIVTVGDKVQDKPLADIGGKGLFIKALEQALLDNKADVAVHSMKDVPPELSHEFTIAAILKRADHRDVLLSQNHTSFANLAEGAVIGTCSVRRQAQLLSQRPDLRIKSLRGNVDTRVHKLKQGEFDAIVLAAAGLHRLGYNDEISEYFSEDVILPSVAQGAIGVECLTARQEIVDIVAPLVDAASMHCVMAERTLIQRLKGDCHSPIGVYATLENEQLHLQGLVAMNDGSQCIHAKASGLMQTPGKIITAVADDLFAQGARDILDKHFMNR